MGKKEKCKDFSLFIIDFIFSSPGRSPGRAIVLPLAWALVAVLALEAALAKSLTLKFFM